MEVKIVNAQQMYNIDRITIEQYKIPDILLMENAGISISHFIQENYPHKKNIMVLTGTGNNGGDGLVCARQLALNHYNVKIFFIGENYKRTRSNRLNYMICRKLNIPIIRIRKYNDLLKHKSYLLNCDIIIDAVLGIGLKSILKDPLNKIIPFINTLTDKIKIAVDLPSGLSADNSRVSGEVFHADLTFTFGLPKISQVLSPARKFVGRLIVQNIGFPEELLSDSSIQTNLLTAEKVKQLLPQRIPDHHKNDFGHVLCFTGSVGKTGAAVLSSQAALKAGAGLVTTVCDQEINVILENNLIEVMTCPLELSDRTAINRITDLLDGADVILTGCGIGLNNNTRNFLKQLLSVKNKTIVLDADAVNIIAENKDILKQNSNHYILTPHIGEFCRLVKLEKDELYKNIFKITRDFCREYNVILVLKSCETMIIDPQGNIFISTAGNEGMATAGSGDVLAGLTAGLTVQNIKQNKPVLDAVLAAVFLHGLSGDLAMEKQSSYTLNARDLIEYLPRAFKKVCS